MMTDKSVLNQANSEALQAVLRTLSTLQIRFVIARTETKSDVEACELIGISPATCRNWENKADVNEAVKLMHMDGMITALELRRRHLAKAMAVKAAGLESENEKIRQEVATELIEWELGRATQPTDNKHSGQVTLIWDLPIPPRE